MRNELTGPKQAEEALRRRQEELLRVNRQLEDTNRGIMALYAELEEKADHLRHVDQVKSRFLSNLGHEFRTTLSSILALSHLLLDSSGGKLSPEQQKLVAFIRMAARQLSDLAHDLLDLSKIEAGKMTVRTGEFEVTALFSVLRGMLRPLHDNPAVDLVFDEPAGIPALHTDQGKLLQILRNLIVNALKFTERGEVRVGAQVNAGGAEVIFSVADTGIGIAPEEQENIFQEFAQLESSCQHRTKGTGLGLPLSRKLAELLGGRLSVESRPGVGSTFSAVIPLIYP